VPALSTPTPAVPPPIMVTDAWYVTALGSEVGDELLSRSVLGRSVVPYRTADGTPVALRDRCSHGGYPLSAGAPETERTSHYVFAVARDWRVDDPELSTEFRITIAVFGQDKEALEAIEQAAPTHPGPLREMSVRADQPGPQLRRLVKQRIEAECAARVQP
jgi:Vanillate O-demethylase oxygenase C-terminal domain/Rieske [2Fe-2S] domain